MKAEEFINTMKNLNIWKNFRDNMFMIELLPRDFIEWSFLRILKILIIVIIL